MNKGYELFQGAAFASIYRLRIGNDVFSVQIVCLSECFLLFKARSAIPMCLIYHGKNKLLFDDMKKIYIQLDFCSTSSIILSTTEHVAVLEHTIPTPNQPRLTITCDPK